MYPSDADLKSMARAIKGGDVAAVRDLIEGKVYVRGTYLDRVEKQTALHVAAMSGKPEICRLLLKHGADARARNVRGATPLHAAFGSGRDAADGAAAEVCALLLRAGADLHAVTEEGWTPLALAASWGEGAAVRELLAKGAIVDAADKVGLTPLHRAAGMLDAEVCRQLIDAGACANAYDDTGTTPLHRIARAASEVGDPAVASTIEVLVAAGADPSFTPHGFEERFGTPFRTTYLTPFQSAVRMHSLEAVRYYVECCGVDPAQVTIDGRTMESIAGEFRPRTTELLQSLVAARAIAAGMSEDAHGAERQRECSRSLVL